MKVSLEQITAVIAFAKSGKGCKDIQCASCALDDPSLCDKIVIHSKTTIHPTSTRFSDCCKQYILDHPDVFTPDILMEQLL